MLAKQYRLPISIHFPRHTSVAQPSMLIKFCPNDLDHSRFGFLVSKKVSKKAVERNRVRRQLQACVSEKLVSRLRGYDVLIIARPDSAGQEAAVLCAQLVKALAQKGLVDEENSRLVD